MNGKRTETFLLGIHRADYILRQLSLMSFPNGLCSLAFTFIWQPYRCRYPPSFMYDLICILQFNRSVPLPFFFRLIISALYSWGIIFLRSYLGFVKLQGVSREQSSFRQILLKEYSSRQSCLICPIRTSESRKIFPQHSRKALIKGK